MTIQDENDNPYENYEEDEEYLEYYTEGARLHDKGTLALEDGRYYIALTYFLMSKDIEPHFKSFERIYVVLKLLNREAEGFRYLKQGYELKPDNDKTAILYATALADRGNKTEAVEVIEGILHRNSTYGPAKRLLASITDTD